MNKYDQFMKIVAEETPTNQRFEKLKVEFDQGKLKKPYNQIKGYIIHDTIKMVLAKYPQFEEEAQQWKHNSFKRKRFK